ncbi:MAG TPA: ATP-binding protein [Thermoanaerobaculia bacterium]|nr:ATP-binding protein [Thermoanaerobaculia bacterium]
MADRDDRPPSGGRRRELTGIHAALVSATASLIFELWAGWQQGAWRLPEQGKLVEALSLGFLTLTFFLLGSDAVRTRRLVRGLQRAAAEQRREVAELREASITAGATPVTGELPLLTFALDAHGRFERFNPRWLEMLGCSAGALSRRRFTDLLPADQLGVWRDLETTVLAGSPVPRFQISLLARGGRLVFVEGSAWPRGRGRREDDPEPPGIAGSLVDVTPHRQTESALQDSEARFRTLFENGLGFVCIHDLEGRLLSVNPAAAGALGFTAGELGGRHLAELLAPGVRDGFPEYLESLRQGRSADGLMRLLTRNGEERVWMFRNAVHSPLNGPPYVLGFAFDVTEPRQARQMMEAQRRAYLDQIQRQNLELELHRQEAVRANRLKSEFLATMSHELRTPLNAIVGFSELLADDPAQPLSDKQGVHLQFVRTAAEHLLRLINDILDLSKIEAGRLKLSPETLRVAVLLPEVLSTLGPLVAQKGLQLDQRVPDDLQVFADRLHLKQILFNLLSNAVKFTPAGGAITLSGKRLSGKRLSGTSESGFSLLSVANSGSTIDPAEQEMIFDEFQQARGGGETREGTGLGLAIVRRLVEQHAGKVWVESTPGTGTEFVVLLPDRQERPATTPPTLPHVQRATGEPAILLVSDDALARQRWSEALRRQRFSVRAVVCDDEALPLLRRSEPQLAILDLASAGARGARLLRELRAQESAFQPLILALVADLAGRRPAFLAGAHGCLTLPVDDKLLVEACRRRLEPLDPPRVVLIVEANPERQRRLTEATIAAGFRPVVVAGGANSLQTAAQIHPHAVVMDLQLPSLDGYQTIVRLRSNPATANIPVLVLARKGDDAVETQVFSGPTRLLWLPDDDWRDFVTLEIQRTVEAERWLLPAAG